MKRGKILLVMCCCAVMASNAAAVISSDAAGNWAIEIPETEFVPYATANYGASSSIAIPMVTIMAPAKGYVMTTAETAGEAVFEIPFTFAQPLVTCGLDFGTLINSNGDNDGYV